MNLKMYLVRVPDQLLTKHVLVENGARNGKILFRGFYLFSRVKQVDRLRIPSSQLIKFKYT